MRRAASAARGWRRITLAGITGCQSRADRTTPGQRLPDRATGPTDRAMAVRHALTGGTTDVK
ncbi:hypothetical protein B5M42_018415 [Paenibacillus athensensis]|uniref:Uncharacterized protein n=1 Tax=Paenibacillus athensensis TaxID=1967502 RepID=A0A4Y8Q6V0_9BACL|nr:hypothetical protein [Paenibacillus athensensis]MCD1260778.1 hypothetical protein [Paenibacillus athensensis]